MATAVVNINDVLHGHAGLDVTCVDRLYLNVYVPNLQVGGQVITFLTEHRGNPVPSPALFKPMGDRFRQLVGDFAQMNGIPLLRLGKPDRSRWDDRKLDHVRPYIDLAERQGRIGVVAIVAAQEIQKVSMGYERGKGTHGKAVNFGFDKADRTVTVYYFYILDPQCLFIEPAAFPAGPQQADGFAVITAAQALAVMRAEGTPGPLSPTPLVITGVRLDTASYATDRGNRSLPAWLFSFEDVQNPVAVLAVAESSRFAPAKWLGSSVGARLGQDGRSATIFFVGWAPGRGPCTADYTVDQLDSGTAHAVLVRETRFGGGPCRTVGYGRQVDITLDTPLGNRVLVDAKTKAPVPLRS